MKPIGPLMWEHRLIEHMVDLLRLEIDRITDRKTANVILIEQAVDFFRTYADRTHHGKEPGAEKDVSGTQGHHG